MFEKKKEALYGKTDTRVISFPYLGWAINSVHK